MSNGNITDRLAVCSWSLEPTSPAELSEKLDRVGIKKVQLDLMPLVESPAWSNAKADLAASGVEVIGGMMRAEGEDYSTLESIKRTGGIVPDDTWPTTWGNMQQMAAHARELGLRYVMFHAGFLPHEKDHPDYDKLAERLARVADLFGEMGADVGLETGQEEADTLLAFLEGLGKPNVKVNFDPANMILYDKGDPIEALRKLAPHLGQCHIKDATRTKTPGEWGAEVPVGQGEVDWSAFFRVLNEAGFNDYLAIEREAGEQRVEDIATAREQVEKNV